MSDQAAEKKIDVQYALSASLREKDWRVDVYANGDRYRAEAKKGEYGFEFSVHGATAWVSWSRAARIAELIELGLDAEQPDVAEPPADTATRRLEGLGQAVGTGVAAYYTAMKAGGIEAETALSMAQAMSARLWDAAFGDRA